MQLWLTNFSTRAKGVPASDDEEGDNLRDILMEEQKPIVDTVTMLAFVCMETHRTQ